MDDLATLAAFDTAERHLEHLSGVVPDHLVADAHPRYRSRAWAVRHAAGRPVRTVQHHHAHVAAVMAEHGHAAARDRRGVRRHRLRHGRRGVGRRGARRRLPRVPSVRAPRLRAAARRRRDGAPAVPDGAGPPARRRHPVGRRPAAGRGVPAGRARRAGPPARHRAGLRAHLQRRPAVRRGQLPAGRAAHGRLRGPGRDRAGEPRPRRPRPTARTRSRSTRTTPLLADPAPVLRALVADLRAGVAAGVAGARFHAAVVDLVVELARRARDRARPGHRRALRRRVRQRAAARRRRRGAARRTASPCCGTAGCLRTTAGWRWASWSSPRADHAAHKGG